MKYNILLDWTLDENKNGSLFIRSDNDEKKKVFIIDGSSSKVASPSTSSHPQLF
jgi:hypothetical protein